LNHLETASQALICDTFFDQDNRSRELVEDSEMGSDQSERLAIKDVCKKYSRFLDLK